MKKRSLVVLSHLVLVALLLAGCQQQGQALPSDPVAAVKLIVDKQKEVKTQHSALELDLVLKVDGLPSNDPTAALLQNFKANAKIEGDFDNAASDFSLQGEADLGILTAFLAGGADTIQFEAVKLGDKVYTRLADQEWSESSADLSSATGDETQAPACASDMLAGQLNELLKKVATAEKLDDVAIDGVDSYHFRVSLDAVELINAISALAAECGGEAIPAADLEQAGELLKDTELTLEMWVGKSDLFVRQQKFHLGLNLRDIPDAPAEMVVNADLDVTTKASKINEPVTITDPTQ